MKVIQKNLVLVFLLITTMSFGQSPDGEKKVIIQKIIIDKASGDSSVVIIDDLSAGEAHSFIYESDDWDNFVLPSHPNAGHFAWVDSFASGKGHKYFYKFDSDSIDFDFDFAGDSVFNFKFFTDSCLPHHKLDSNNAVWFSHRPGQKMVWEFHDSLLMGDHNFIIQKFIDGEHIEEIIEMHADKIPHKEMKVHAFHTPDGNKHPRVIVIEKDGMETIEVEENDSITIVGAGDKKIEMFVYKTKNENVKLQITPLEKKELKSLAKEQNISGEPTLDVSDFMVKPNPNNGRFRLSFNLPSEEPAYIKIVDSVGKAVYAKKISGSLVNEYIDISNDKKGIFFIIIEQVNSYYTRKVFID